MRWSNLSAFRLKNRQEALLHNLLQERKVCLFVTFTLPLFRKGLWNRKVPSEPWQGEEIICAHTSGREERWEAFWTVCQRLKICQFANVNLTNYYAKKFKPFMYVGCQLHWIPLVNTELRPFISKISKTSNCVYLSNLAASFSWLSVVWYPLPVRAHSV